MHDVNGYIVTPDLFDVAEISIGFLDEADIKQCQVIKIDGKTVRVPEIIGQLWQDFGLFDKKFANLIVKSYKTTWQFVQLEMSRRKLERENKYVLPGLIFDELGRILAKSWQYRSDELIYVRSKQHSLTIGCYIGDDCGLIVLKLCGPWHRYDSWPIIPAPSRDEASRFEPVRPTS